MAFLPGQLGIRACGAFNRLLVQVSAGGARTHLHQQPRTRPACGSGGDKGMSLLDGSDES